MKTPLLIGIILLVVGVGALAYTGVRYATRDTTVDAAPIAADAEHERTPPLSPMLSVAALAAGTVLVIVGKRKRPLF